MGGAPEPSEKRPLEVVVCDAVEPDAHHNFAEPQGRSRYKSDDRSDRDNWSSV